MEWVKALDGFVSQNGEWRIRGPIMGKPMYWLYRNHERYCLTSNKYDTAVNFPTIESAQKFVNDLLKDKTPT